MTTISFDIFVLETLLPLTKGSKIILADENEQRDPKRMKDLIIQNKVDMVQITPSRLQLLLEDGKDASSLKQIKEIIVGGEAFPEKLLVNLQQITNARLFNMYGPTETTVWSTMKELTMAEEVNIGKPIANTQIYILGENLELLPQKVIGELYIAGDGLARGYFKRSDLTEDRFILNPFIPGKKMYKTGDLARWLPNGEIEFIGRKDRQIKIRGYRIETGEIETSLNKYDSIKESVVLAKESEKGYKYLVGYYLSDSELPVSELRSHLLQYLPDYMVPSFFVHLESLPLTPNGKIDYKVLPEIDSSRPHLNQSYLAPETEIEKKIAIIWEELLGIELVGVNDNFFELGGNSILIVQMHNRLEKYFPGKVTTADLFAYPTITKLTKCIEDQLGIEMEEIDKEKLSYEREYWANELREPWELLRFPKDYYLDGKPSNKGITFNLQLKENVFKKLKGITVNEKVDNQDVLTAMYIYLLSEISDEKDVLITATMKNSSSRTFPFRVNLAKITDFNELFRMVNRKYLEAEEMGNFPIEMEIREKNTPESILALIAGTTDIRTDLYDLTLKVEEEEDQISLIFGYNYSKLKNNKVEEFVTHYGQLLEMLINEYYG